MPDMLESAERLARDIPRSRKVILRDTAHLPSLEQPEAVNRLALDFLEECVSG